MKHHSKTSNWLRNLYQENLVGIESDYAGLGRKLSELSLTVNRDMKAIDALMFRLQSAIGAPPNQQHSPAVPA